MNYIENNMNYIRYIMNYIEYHYELYLIYYQARARSVRARSACALRALGLLLADGTPTVGGGKTF